MFKSLLLAGVVLSMTSVSMAQTVQGSITQTNGVTVGAGTTGALNNMSIGSFGSSGGSSLGNGSAASASGGSLAAQSISAGQNSTVSGKNTSIAENTGSLTQNSWQNNTSWGQAGAISGSANAGSVVGAGAASGGYLTIITESTLGAGVSIVNP